VFDLHPELWVIMRRKQIITVMLRQQLVMGLMIP
jgi:hypothetical protein